jgi:hypothetical protein
MKILSRWERGTMPPGIAEGDPEDKLRMVERDLSLRACPPKTLSVTALRAATPPPTGEEFRTVSALTTKKGGPREPPF